MSNSQQILVTQQLILTGPLSLKEAYPQISLSTATAILLIGTALLVKILTTKSPFSLPAFTGHLITSWALTSFSMILASYLAA